MVEVGTAIRDGVVESIRKIHPTVSVELREDPANAYFVPSNAGGARAEVLVFSDGTTHLWAGGRPLIYELELDEPVGARIERVVDAITAVAANGVSGGMFSLLRRKNPGAAWAT